MIEREGHFENEISRLAEMKGEAKIICKSMEIKGVIEVLKFRPNPIVSISLRNEYMSSVSTILKLLLNAKVIVMPTEEFNTIDNLEIIREAIGYVLRRKIKRKIY